MKEYVIITLGMLLYIVGWSVFLVPNQLVGGGVSGLASVVQYATNGAVKMGYTYFVVNVVLLIIAMFILGNKFGFKTIYAIVIASVGLNVFQEIIPADICQTLAVENGKLMSSIMGGLMAGVGIGLCMSQGGSTGGTDIIALIVNKYRNVSPGKMILAMDVVIILSSLLVPIQDADGSIMQFNEKITTCVYGFILIVVNGTVLDMVIAGTRQSVQLFILSKKHKEIADAITNDLHRGVTVLNGMGWYTKEPTEVLMVLTRKYDLNVLLRYIKNIDPEAFLSVSTVTGVYGKGFESIKTGRKK
ncbi:MAG: YitT family protein [Candidatus Cryptobacteroides sp.]|nr:YitT family protein [Bacteroidales bacterium]MDY5459001.1 YitT family protein [Candidatus Cryptobacteroides sp.]